MNHTNIATFQGFDAPHNRVKEAPGVYIPDLLSDEDYEADPKVHSAAAEYSKHLYAAKDLMGESRSLAGYYWRRLTTRLMSGPRRSRWQ